MQLIDSTVNQRKFDEIIKAMQANTFYTTIGCKCNNISIVGMNKVLYEVQ